MCMPNIHNLLINIYDLVICERAHVFISEIKFSTVLMPYMQDQKTGTVFSTDVSALFFISENSAFHFLIIVVKTCTFPKDTEYSDLKRNLNKNNQNFNH